MSTVHLVTTLLLAVSASGNSHAQDFTGRWVYQEAGQTATLDLRHDGGAGRISASLEIEGGVTRFEGAVEGGIVSFDTMDGDAIPAGLITLTPDGDGVIVMSMPRAGADPVLWRMTRVGPAPSAATLKPDRVPAPGVALRAASPDEFSGEWQAMSDDETSGEVVELAVSGNTVQGAITVASRGYFSGRVTVESQVSLEGMFRDGGFEVTLTNVETGGVSRATFRMRSEFLIFLVDGTELGVYARPGRPLVASAETSPEATALAHAIRGKVYSVSQQAAGRGGFVGGRFKVAFCANGSMTYDASNVGSVPGGTAGETSDLGSSISRRGVWNIVLLGGAPAIRADWEGTGTSYSLTRYFRVRPSADGRSALIDGAEIPLAGGC